MEERVLTIYGAPVSVFSDGSVWIHRGNRNKRRFGSETYKGYKSVLIRENGVSHTVFVHRLVAMAFVPNPENKPQVNHKNGIKSDNRPENLEWCTGFENQRHRREVLHSYGKRIPIVCVETGVVYESILAASKDTGINRANIMRSIRTERLGAGSFHWRVI